MTNPTWTSGRFSKHTAPPLAAVSKAKMAVPVAEELKPVPVMNATLKDLCQEDKARVGELIRRLAVERQEKEALQAALQEQKNNYESRIEKLKAQNESIIQETVSLKSKFNQSVALLKTYQDQLLQTPAVAEVASKAVQADLASPVVVVSTSVPPPLLSTSSSSSSSSSSSFVFPSRPASQSSVSSASVSASASSSASSPKRIDLSSTPHAISSHTARAAHEISNLRKELTELTQSLKDISVPKISLRASLSDKSDKLEKPEIDDPQNAVAVTDKRATAAEPQTSPKKSANVIVDRSHIRNSINTQSPRFATFDESDKADTSNTSDQQKSTYKFVQLNRADIPEHINTSSHRQSKWDRDRDRPDRSERRESNTDTESNTVVDKRSQRMSKPVEFDDVREHEEGGWIEHELNRPDSDEDVEQVLHDLNDADGFYDDSLFDLLEDLEFGEMDVKSNVKPVKSSRSLRGVPRTVKYTMR